MVGKKHEYAKYYFELFISDQGKQGLIEILEEGTLFPFNTDQSLFITLNSTKRERRIKFLDSFSVNRGKTWGLWLRQRLLLWRKNLIYLKKSCNECKEIKGRHSNLIRSGKLPWCKTMFFNSWDNFLPSCLSLGKLILGEGNINCYILLTRLYYPDFSSGDNAKT